MKRSINWLVAGGVIALVAVFSLVVGLMPRPLPPSTQYIPAYPNATHLHQDYTSIKNVKVLDFQTSANPQTIQDYYKGILLKKGWKIDTSAYTRHARFSLLFLFTT